MRYEHDFLAHYGVKGQTWGVRRYQNEDGSLTPAGKAHYYGETSGESSGKKKKTTGINKEGEPVKTKSDSSKWKPSDAEKLSDDELNRRNSRLQRERQYKDSTTPQWQKDAKQNAKNWATEAFKRIFIGTATTVAVAVAMKNAKKIGAWLENRSKVKLDSLKNQHSLQKSISKAADRYSGSGVRRQPSTYDYRPRSSNSQGKSFSWPSISGSERRQRAWNYTGKTKKKGD